METKIIACATIEEEFKQALKIAKRDYPAVFLKPGLDNDPQALRQAIKAEMATLTAPGRIILGYGFSNGALVDFPCGQHTVVAPQAEDGICLILGSQVRRDKILTEKSTYFITEGWLKGDDLFSTFQKAVEKYGLAKAGRMQKTMMSHYQRFLLVDTGVYDLDKYRGKLNEMAEVLGLTVEETKGELSWLVRLVSGPPWGDYIIEVSAGGTLTIDPKAGSQI